MNRFSLASALTFGQSLMKGYNNCNLRCILLIKVWPLLIVVLAAAITAVVVFVIIIVIIIITSSGVFTGMDMERCPPPSGRRLIFLACNNLYHENNGLVACEFSSKKS